MRNRSFGAASFVAGGLLLAGFGVHHAGCFFDPGTCHQCTDETGTSTSSTTSTTTSAGGGGGSGGGSGGSGGSVCDGVCVPAVDGATYVVFSNDCDAGNTELDLLDCDACSCTAAAGTCQLDGGSELDDDSACSASGGPAIVGPGCLDLGSPYTAANVYVKAQTSLATPGTCTPSADPSVTPCQLTMPGSCDAGTGSNSGVCVPTSQATCLLVGDNSDCAAIDPAYMTPRTLYEGGTCNCDCDVVEDCPDEVVLYSDDACVNNAITVAANDLCNPSGATSVGSVEAQAAVASCTSSNSPNNGDPIRLCCLAQ